MRNKRKGIVRPSAEYGGDTWLSPWPIHQVAAAISLSPRVFSLFAIRLLVVKRVPRTLAETLVAALDGRLIGDNAHDSDRLDRDLATAGRMIVPECRNRKDVSQDS